MIGTVVGNFRMVERLGEGGMGTVYRAMDEMLDREVAIKVLRPELSRQAALLERFRQEAMALARLNHPRIATLHGLERHSGDLLMIMEYVRGDTLEKIVERSGKLSWRRSAELCIAILDALDHAHDKGVVHRDIKPANVMLSHKGAVKVMDFGIARVMGRNRQTQFGHSVGTPMYMSPEQLRGEEVDGRADLYAVGAVLFELVTGRIAFDADSDYRLMMMQLNDPPPVPSSVVSDVPMAIDAIVAKAMSKRADDRFANAVLFREALERAIVPSVASAPRAVSPATRLSDLAPSPVPSSAYATPAVAAAPGATSEHVIQVSAPVAETRLASPSAVAPASEAPSPPTRLASEAPGDYRATPLAPTSRSSGASMPSWTGDWRRWVSIAALLTIAAAGMRTWRARTPQNEPGDTTRVSPISPAGNGSRAVGSLGDMNRPREATANADPPPYVPAPLPEPLPPVAPRTDLTPSGPVGRADPPPSRPSRKRAAESSGRGVAVTRDPPAKATPQPEPPVSIEKPRATSERAASPEREREEIAGAVERLTRSAARMQSVLRAEGETQTKMLDLLKAGRITIGVQGSPAIDMGDSRATATFGVVVNVRSPFGANRRSDARFVAQLERDGDAWRVTSLRPLGSIDLR